MLQIDTERCIGCGVCEANCAFGAIAVVDGVAEVNEQCTLCGTCVDSCEVGALTIDRQEGAEKTDLASWSGILVYAETRRGSLAPVALELLGAGRRLADARRTGLAALLLGHDVAHHARTLISYGAEQVFVADHPALEQFTDDAYGNVLADLITRQRPEVVLAGATAMGRSFIPRVATMMATGLTADCTDLAIRPEDGALLQTRPAFGGNIMATIETPRTRPQMATVRPNVMQAMEPDPERQGEVIILDLDETLLQSRVKVVASERTGSTDSVNLSEADVVVAGGRGVGGPEGFRMLTELAALLNGSVAASRAAVDAGWIEYPYQVGQTGKTVCPKLYISCGISGAIQHIVGMRSSATIVAINRDPDAPIFDIATYGLVGNLEDIVPCMIAKLKQEAPC